MRYDFSCPKCDRLYEIDIPMSKLEEARKQIKCVDCKCKLKRDFRNQDTYFRFKDGFSTKTKTVDGKFGDPTQEVRDLDTKDRTTLDISFSKEDE